MAIQWDTSYATDQPEVDAQHRQLFDILNDLEKQLKRGDTPQQLRVILDRLVKYTREHFAFEEKVMELCDCPTARVNKLAHDRFIRMVDDAMQEARAATATRDLFAKLHQEVEQWLRSHVHKIDRKLRETVTRPVGV